MPHSSIEMLGILVLFLDLFKLILISFKALELEAEDIAEQCLHMYFQLKHLHLETLRDHVGQDMLDDFDSG